ncbi:MAG: hypothetical protein ACFCUQ_22925, partial [Kiloniellales bacterium]
MLAMGILRGGLACLNGSLMSKKDRVFSRHPLAVVGMVLAVTGCSFSEDSLWPSLTGEDPTGATAPSAAVSAQP